MDFKKALDIAIGEITPQPWEYTADGGATLTVIPEGLRAGPGDAEVMLCITTSKTTAAAEAGVTTTDLPALIDAIEHRTAWAHETALRDTVTVTAELVLTVTEFDWSTAGRPDAEARLHLPEDQRLPLASALRRALDVARGWED